MDAQILSALDEVLLELNAAKKVGVKKTSLAKGPKKKFGASKGKPGKKIIKTPPKKHTFTKEEKRLWSKMSEDQQVKYLEEHPRSKYKALRPEKDDKPDKDNDGSKGNGASIESQKQAGLAVSASLASLGMNFNLNTAEPNQLVAQANNVKFFMEGDKTDEVKKTYKEKAKELIKGVIEKLSPKDRKELDDEFKHFKEESAKNPDLKYSDFVNKFNGTEKPPEEMDKTDDNTENEEDNSETDNNEEGGKESDPERTASNVRRYGKIAAVVGIAAVGILTLGVIAAIDPGVAMYLGITAMDRAADKIMEGMRGGGDGGGSERNSKDDESTDLTKREVSSTPATISINDENAPERLGNAVTNALIENKELASDGAAKVDEKLTDALAAVAVPIKGTKSDKQNHWADVAEKAQAIIDNPEASDEEKKKAKATKATAVRNMLNPELQNKPPVQPAENNAPASSDNTDENEDDISEEDNNSDDEELDDEEEPPPPPKKRKGRKVKAYEILAETDNIFEHVLSLLNYDEDRPPAVLSPIKKPTYAALKLHPASARLLKKWAEESAGLKNVYPPGEFHITVCYSRDPITYTPMKFIDGPKQVYPDKLDLLGREEDKMHLVLKLKEGFPHERFKYAEMQGASHDFPEYLPHITISPPGHGLTTAPNIDVESIDFPLLIDYEYADELNADDKKEEGSESLLTEKELREIARKQLGKLLIRAFEDLKEQNGMVIKTISEKPFNDYMVVRKEVWWMKDRPHEPTAEMEVFYNNNGDYVGGERAFAKQLDKLGINPQKRKPDSNVCSIGFSEKNGKWYGWSHRAIHGFKPGDEVKEGDLVSSSGWTEEWLKYHPEDNDSLPVGFKAKNFDDAKRMAEAFAESVASVKEEIKAGELSIHSLAKKYGFYPVYAPAGRGKGDTYWTDNKYNIYVKKNGSFKVISIQEFIKRGKEAYLNIKDIKALEKFLKSIKQETTAKVPEKYQTYTLKVNDYDKALWKLLEFLKKCGHDGHSVSFQIDDERFGFDGDGADKIYEMEEIDNK